MPKVEVRYQRVSDAKRYFAILNNPNFKYFHAKPKSINDERAWLKKNKEKRKNNFSYNYAILYGDKLIGGCGIKIDQHHKGIGEIGYFIDELYWGRGITPKAVRILERIGFEKLKLHRIEIRMNPKNRASVRVAQKCGYKKEGLLKAEVFKEDVYLYAKVKV